VATSVLKKKRKKEKRKKNKRKHVLMVGGLLYKEATTDRNSLS